MTLECLILVFLLTDKHGATTLNIMTLSITGLYVTLSITDSQYKQH
jgi:hypothetical protein